MYFESKIYKILNEKDEFKAKAKDSDRVVVFKSKDAMDAAIKGGSHEPLDKPSGKSKDATKGTSVFDTKPKDDSKPAKKDSGGSDDNYIHIGDGRYKERNRGNYNQANLFSTVYTKKGEGDFSIASDEDQSKYGAEMDGKPIVATDVSDDPRDIDQRSQYFQGDPYADSEEPKPDAEEIDTALQAAEEGIYDTLDRSMSYGDNPDVDDMLKTDVQNAIDAGASESDMLDFSDNLDEEGRYILQSVLDALGYDIDVLDNDVRPSDPDYKSPGERDTKGSENPYDFQEPDDFEDGTLGDMTGDDMDKGIDDAIDGIRPEYREQAFDAIVQSFDDEDELRDIYDNLEANKMPKPSEDPYGAIKHRVIMQGIEDGTIDFGTTGMELANYIETREEDLYQQMTENTKFNKPLIQERISVKKMLRKRAGLL